MRGGVGGCGLGGCVERKDGEGFCVEVCGGGVCRVSEHLVGQCGSASVGGRLWCGGMRRGVGVL